MLADVDLSARLSKAEEKARRPVLQNRAFELQRACWEKRIATLIVVEGFAGARKGTSIKALTERLEPRRAKVYPVKAPRTHELGLPWLWRFWMKLPNYGEIAVFDQSWYRRVFIDKVEGTVKKREWRRAYDDITDFEQMIAADGYLILKLFFHISRKQQKKQLRRLERDELTAWQVGPDAWRRHRLYDELRESAETMITATDRPWAPWTIVEAANRRWARVRTLEIVTQRMEAALAGPSVEVPPIAVPRLG